MLGSLIIHSRGPYIPTDELLHTSAPLSVWEVTKKEASRSPLKRFKVGATIFNSATKEVIGSGCAHFSEEKHQMSCTFHAERHALRRTYNKSLEGAWIVIYTMNGSGGCAWSSRPCYSCALSLYKNNIERIVYPERNADNTWNIVSELPESLLERAGVVETGKYARAQRISGSGSV